MTCKSPGESARSARQHKARGVSPGSDAKGLGPGPRRSLSGKKCRRHVMFMNDEGLWLKSRRSRRMIVAHRFIGGYNVCVIDEGVRFSGRLKTFFGEQPYSSHLQQ